MVLLNDSDSSRLISRIKDVAGFILKPPVELITDTEDFIRISRGQVIELEGRQFVVSGYVYEPRFGLEDQPKFWVRRGYDLETGQTVIIKFEFYEEFVARFGSFQIPCYRSPEKESEVLNLVKNDPRFMHGYTLLDSSGNNVRIIEYINGKSLYTTILDLDVDHEYYYHTYLIHFMHKLIDSLEGLQMLHENDLCHGDIRNDHILIEDRTNQFRWIDFDLNQDVMFDPYETYAIFDVWSTGRLLQFVVGMGLVTFHDIQSSNTFSSDTISKLQPGDASAFHYYRLMNLKKIYPYISEPLNNILMRFSMSADDYYWSMSDLIRDLYEAIVYIPKSDVDPFKNRC